jgi:hypothetical protein
MLPRHVGQPNPVLEKFGVVPDSELWRLGWARMQDPIAKQPSEAIFW